MEDVLYADILFFVNFSMDFITLYLTSRLTSGPPAGPRFAVSAALGAFFGTVFVAAGVDGAAGAAATACVSLSMIFVAFGKCGAELFLRRTAIFWGCAALLGGIMTALCFVGGDGAGQGPGGTTVLLLLGSAVCVPITKAIMHVKRRRSVRVAVEFSGRSAVFDALCDSGNLLCDPLSSRPVILADMSVVRPLLPWLKSASAASLDTDMLPPEMTGRVRLIPVKGFGGDGLLVGFVPESVTLLSTPPKKCADGTKGERLDAVIAVTQLGDRFFGGFPANAPFF